MSELKSGKASRLDGWLSSGGCKERWYGSVRMTCGNLERKF